MALKAIICKAGLHIADMERHYYQTHALTIARHPSENDERMMLRVLVFALHASESLTFTKGISTADEPDIWAKHLNGEIESWIDLGQPDEKRIRQACGKARNVWIYNYGSRSAGVWWRKHQSMLTRFNNLSVMNIPDTAVKALGLLAQKTMDIQCNIDDGHVLVVAGEHSLHIDIEKRL